MWVFLIKITPAWVYFKSTQMRAVLFVRGTHCGWEYAWTCWKQSKFLKSLLQMKSNWLFSVLSLKQFTKKLHWLSHIDDLISMLTTTFRFCYETKHHLRFDLLPNFHKMTLNFKSSNKDEEEKKIRSSCDAKC